MRFTEKVAIVTGVGQRMGRQVTIDMAAEGARIVATDILENKIAAMQHEIEAHQRQCLALRCDIADRQQVDEMIKHTVDTFGRVDILINNAGLLLPGTIEEATDE